LFETREVELYYFVFSVEGDVFFLETRVVIHYGFISTF
jgi:hypothetical protein